MEKKRKMENMALHRKPHFFKVLLGDFACQLKLPPNFLKHISNESSENAILVGPNGRRWSVKIKTTLGGTYLSTGWSNFVKYYSLKVREFLVFQYNGKMHFSIQVFDTTACEREDLFDLPTYKKPKIGFNNHESEEDLKKAISYISQGNFASRIGKTKSEMGKLLVNLDASKSISGIKYSEKCLFVTEGNLQASEAAKSFCSDCPSVIVHMTASKVRFGAGAMRLPTCFSQKHLPRKKTNMRVSDPKENVWTVAYCPGNREKDGRDKLGRGWSKLVCANNIHDGDYCVFELKAPTEAKVHIFRACRSED